MWAKKSLRCSVICQVGKQQEEAPLQLTCASVTNLKPDIVIFDNDKKILHIYELTLPVTMNIDQRNAKIFTPYHRHHWLQLHSELIWGELHRLHQQEKQINTPHTAQIHETRHKEIDIFEQPQLPGLVWKLQKLVDKRWPHLCRPALPHPSPQVNPFHLDLTLLIQ